MIIQDETLDRVVSVNNVVWKEVPGYFRCYASSEGNIGLLKLDNTITECKETKWKTTKGTYLYSKILKDINELDYVAKHRLVCLAFHGLPPDDGKVYEPNHIDGDKHNNKPINLEWATRSQNVQHAFDSGLCTAGLRVEAINVQTNEVRTYNSLNSMSKEWSIPRNRLRNIIASHKVLPYNSQWIFKLDDSSDKKITRYQYESIIFKDYAADEIHVVSDAQSAMEMTGIKAGSILSKTRGKQKNNLSLLGRYVFQMVKEKVDWPIYTAEEALKAEEVYFGKPVTERNIPCVMKNYLTGEVYVGSSFIELGRLFSSLTGNNFTMLKKYYLKDNLDLYKGFIVKRQDNLREWPIYSEQEVRDSLRSKATKVTMIDILTNTTKIYSTREELKKDIGISELILRKGLDTGELIRDRYIFELTNDYL